MSARNMKYNIGDQVKTVVTPGIGKIIAVKNHGKKGDYYQVEFSNYPAIWHPENEITLTNEKPAKHYESMDIDSGLGIGGINNDQSMPFIPSVAAIERVQKMHDTDTVCRKCGASENFDGAMFTTFGGSNICDDCA